MFRSIAQKTRPLNRLFSNRAYAVKRDDLFWMDDIVRCKKEIKETEEKISKICKQIKEREYFSIANHDKFALLYGKSGIMERLRNSSYSLPLDTPYWAYPAIYQDSKRLLELLNTKDPRFFADKVLFVIH